VAAADTRTAARRAADCVWEGEGDGKKETRVRVALEKTWRLGNSEVKTYLSVLSQR